MAEHSPTAAAVCEAIRGRGLESRVHCWLDVEAQPVLTVTDALLLLIERNPARALEWAARFRGWPIGFVDAVDLAEVELDAAMRIGPVLRPWWTPIDLDRVLGGLLASSRRRFPAGSDPAPVIEIPCRGVFSLPALRERGAFIVVRNRQDLAPGIEVMLQLRFAEGGIHQVAARVAHVDDDPIHGLTSLVDPYGLSEEMLARDSG